MPAPPYRFLTCDEDGSLWQWRYRPEWAVWRPGQWDVLPLREYTSGKPVRGQDIDALLAAGVELPKPGGIKEIPHV